MKQTRSALPWAWRWLVYFLSTLLTFLWIWLLGFILADIGDLQGPDLEIISRSHVDSSLVRRAEDLQTQVGNLEIQISRQREIQQDLKSSMDNARGTMQQMMNLHRLSLEQKIAPSETEQNALATSQTRFLDAQDRYEQANNAIATSNQKKFELGQELKSVQQRIEEQRRPALEQYEVELRRHRFKVASIKLAFIVPLFLLSAWLVYRQRESSYQPVFLSMLVATFWKVGTVMFEHFPREFFKYIAISAAIFIVLAFLIWLLRRVMNPGALTLLKRFREGYATHHCPICAYPIARGALKQAVWSRKGPKSAVPLPLSDEEEEPYACPSCGTRLFEKCAKCNSTRRSLLPYCEHCGDRQNVPELESTSRPGV